MSVQQYNQCKGLTRAVIKCCNMEDLLQLSMMDFPLMLLVKLPVVKKMNRFHLQSNIFAKGAENKATGD